MGTGIKVTESQTGSGIWEERVKLKFVGDKYFKPFFPYSGKIYAKNPDNSPAKDERVTVTIDKLGIKRVVYTDSSGYANFSILNLNHSTPYFVINAKTRDSEKTNQRYYTIYPATARKHVKQWYSPSSTYIQLSTTSRHTTCDEILNIDVRYTKSEDTKIVSTTLQIMSKGKIAEFTEVPPSVFQGEPFKPKVDGTTLIPKFNPREMTPDDDIDYENGNSLASGPPAGHGMHAAGPPGSLAGSTEQLKSRQPREAVPFDNDTGEGTKIKDTILDRPAPELRHFNLFQRIGGNFAPKMRILVHMITDTGEIIADTLDIDVDICYENQVDMSFGKSTVRPGGNVDLKISAAPGSLCTTTVADKSVYLHSGLNLPLKSTVLNWLKEYDLTSDFFSHWQYCSDLSELPPDMTNIGLVPIGPPGSDSSTDYVHGPFRKKRSIMQYQSNMYDALLAFKLAGLGIMTDLDLQTRPCLHNGDVLGPPYLPGDPHGPIPGQAGTIDSLEPTEDPVDNRDPVSNLRRYFPETWLWKLYEIPSSGYVSVKETIPDTITEWMGNSLCLNSKAGLGISDITKVTSFQPYFVSVKLPYSVIRGETVNVDVMVYNYLSHCVAIQLKIIGNDKFTLMDTEKDAQFCFCSQKSYLHTFQIKPTQIGKISITFSAFLREHRVTCYSTKAPPGYKNKQVTELLVKDLLVKAEGIKEEKTQSEFICPQDSNGIYKKTIEPDLATDFLVEGSFKGWVSIVGDIMGPVLNGLEDLILLPTGCGEQNMIRLAPNVAILHYLTITKRLAQDMEIKTIDHLNKGYQQQLKFMHSDGSYSAFGTADDAGSTWLSAFVFKTFQQTLGFIYVDRKQVQTKTWEYLLSQQDADGCFIENGKILSKYMMGGVIGSSEDKKRALTAYVLVAMLESFRMMRERTPPFVALAVRCIQVDNLADTYTHALVAYAMSLYKPTSRFTEILINRLLKKARIEDDKMFWRRDKRPDILSGQGQAASAEIEMTSYALLAILSHDVNAPISKVMPIVRWLTSNRNAFGGFVSTQDTVVALQALSLFAERVYGEGLDVSVNITDNTGQSRDIHVTHDNSIILQQHEMVNPASNVEVTIKGMGCILMQTTQRYNVENKLIPEDVFKLQINTPVTKETIDNNCKQRTIKICASYHGPDEESNMVVIEVGLVSGWIPVVSSLEHLMNSVQSVLKKYEMDKENPDGVNLYFDQMYSSNLCVQFDIVHEIDVSDQQPALVKIFDYYESEFESVVFYELSTCTEDNIDEVDVSITDLHVNKPEVDVHNLPAGPIPSVPLGLDDTDSAPAPKPSFQCPQCVSTGVVNILQDLCKKNVWILTANDSVLTLNVLMYDSVSPDLRVEQPELLSKCQQCQPFLYEKGMKSLAFLEPHDWTNVGMNLAQKDVVIIPWSMSVQTSLQNVMESCPPNL